jgi:hypothetical protein
LDGPEEVTLWKAPQAGRPAAQEMIDGFDRLRYPGDGPYFASDKALAEVFEGIYQNGMQEIRIPKDRFEELIRLGVLQPDSYYPSGSSYHVPPDGLALFNDAIRMGSPNLYHSR